jgi:hypothetical protein
MPRSPWWILVAAPLLLVSREAGAICREVTEVGSPPPAIQGDQELLIIERRGVPVGCEPAGGGGGPEDGGPDRGDGGATDAGATDAGATDAGALDAGATDAGALDASILDAGAPGDAAPADGGACQPRLGNTITWVVQPRFSTGPDGARFALLIVTPRPPSIETAARSTFEDLARATAPVKVIDEVTIEDESLGYQCSDPKFGGSGGGCSGGWEDTSGDGWTVPDPPGEVPTDAGLPDSYVRVQTVGSYQVAVLSVRDGAELTDWLDRADYAHQPADIAAIQPYLDLGWTVSAVRVTSDASTEIRGLEPLSFTFEGDEVRLPLGIARAPLGNRAQLTIYTAAAGRTRIPDATTTYAGWTRDGAFLTAHALDADLSRGPEDDPVATANGDNETFQDSYTVVREVRIPSSDCPSGYDGSSDDLDLCGCRTTGGPGNIAGTLILIVGCAAVLLRRRRRRA